ncbi:MAG TPA: DUF4062 domain-containing protein [Thermoanaerobaculia bacterium]|nr:DUF4062 domain-containing protein [Thermoanaerobaculia bacterium]
MPRTSRTFRVFVSSTFTDLKAERDALQERVFPALQQLCRAHDCRFQAIDLRWGVSGEATNDQRALPICIEEVARCQAITPRPNFILLLGDRYGWRPLPYEILADELAGLAACISEPEERRLLDWYRRDDNARPPVDQLRRRAGELADPEVWHWRVERPLRRALERAAEATGLPAAARLKYSASATEQEIEAGALQAQDPRRHVFGFFRTIEGLVPGPASADYLDLDRDGALDREATARLDALKGRLRSHLGSNVRTYRARWTASGVSTDHLDALCEDMLSRLSRVIRREVDRLETEDEQARERTLHAAFGRDRARCFTGRDSPLADIAAYLRGDADRALVVWGHGGSGKSALMAEAVRRAREDHPDAVVIERFVGATPASADGGGLLAGVCLEIAREYDLDDTAIASDFRLLIQELPRRLAAGRAGRPLVLFLDALDQLTSPERVADLDWLPIRLAEHAKLIVSVATGDSLEHLRTREPPPDFVELAPMPASEGDQLLERWLASAGRELTGEQRAAVHHEFARSGLPLYLKLAFEEVRRWRSFDGVGRLGNGVPGAVRALIERLSDDANHGAVLTTQASSYLVAARHGLTEDELLDLLSADAAVLAAFRLRSPRSPRVARLPVVVWSRLYLDLEPYLTERQADGTRVIGFYHRQLAEVLAHEHLDPATLRRAHQSLAAHFDGQQAWLDPVSRLPNRRQASELPWQQWQGGLGGLLDDLEATLTDLEFLEMKCAAGVTYDLVEDYPRAWPAESGDSGPQHVRAFRRFITRHASIFDRDAQQVVPFAWNYAAGGPVARAAEAALERSGWSSRPWIELLDRPPFVEEPALSSTLAGHAGPVTAVRLSADGSLAVSGGEDDTLRIWDVARGVCRHVIPADQKGVNAVAISRDGRAASSGGADGTVKVWEVRSASCVAVLAGHHGEVRSVALADGGRLVSAGDDGLVRVWDVEGGAERSPLAGHFGPVRCVAATADGSVVVSGGEDRFVRVWDARRGRVRAVLRGHATPVQGVAIDATGSVIVSCSGQVPDAGGIVPYDLLDGSEVAFWNQQGAGGPAGSCHEVGERGGRTAGVLASVIHAVALSADGAVAVSGAYDRSVGVWSAARRRAVKRLHGHAERVLDVALDATGRVAASASADGTIHIWSLAGTAPPQRPPTRRIGRIGRGRRTRLAERAGLLWRNARLRRWLVLPAAAAALGAALAISLDALATAMGDAPAARAAASWSRYGGVVLTLLTVAYMIEWRIVLKGDSHVWRQPILPRPLRAILDLALLPILPFFRALDCPLCGSRIAGRRRLFHCASCGFRDPLLLRRER